MRFCGLTFGIWIVPVMARIIPASLRSASALGHHVIVIQSIFGFRTTMVAMFNPPFC
nr:MAG TPA: hypothetical protein [Microviridae sp.]